MLKGFVVFSVCFLCGAFFSNVYPSTDIPLKYIGIEQGLSNNAVTSVYQDQHGFMWFGTYDGLNRYDGYNFKVFRNIWGTNTSLINNHINSITGDSENRIWIGTQRGVGLFNYSNSEITSVYYTPWQQKGTHKLNSDIPCVVGDQKGNVYIATNDAGLIIYRKSAGKCYQVPYNRNAAYSVQSISVDKQNRIWLFIKDAGLCLYDARTNRITLTEKSLARANCLVSDSNSNVYIGAENGLYRYNAEARTFEDMRRSGYRPSNENIMQICIAKTGKLWLATNGGGINILDVVKGHTEYILPGEAKGSVTSGAVSAIYEDRLSRKWIATLRGGINIIDSEKQHFKLISHDPFNSNSLINDFILSFCEDENKNIWIGTDGGGLSYWNTKQNSFTNYRKQPGSQTSLSSNFVVSILKDYTNTIWIASFNGGIDRFDKATKSFIRYKCFNHLKKVVDNNLWKLYEDSRHNLWAGTTWGGSLYLYNRKLDRFELFDDRLTNIHTLYEDSRGTLWAGDYRRLIKIDVKNKKHQFITVNYAIRAMLEDKKHNFWIGTEGGGLLRFNRNNNRFLRYTEKDGGLASNTVLNILEDGKGDIWLSTFNGVTRLSPALNKIKNYYASDGLQSNQFSYNAALKTSSGEFLFGGIKGFNIFNPDSIKESAHLPPLILTGLRVNNTPIENITANGEHASAVTVSQVTIPYNEATISVDYGALEYSYPDKISYAYYLEGWDHDWNYVGKLRTAYYSKLNEGTYVLRIKSTNTEGQWSDTARTIYITVLPPWYRTWWAYMIYMLSLGSIVYSFWRYHIRQTRLKYEIEIANLKVEREKELNEKKLSFFTNISHEFRTPLTLIINPIKDLLKEAKFQNNEDLNTVYRNARRLLGMADHLLLFRKIESENDTLKLVNLDFVALCKEVYLCFVSQAKLKTIQYSFESNAAAVEVAADREKIEVAIFNLISNAFKFTPSGGKIEVWVKDSADKVSLEITDSGCGIPDGIGEKLFDKYYQIKTKSSAKMGFGIGLYVVKSFVKNHGGSICYKKNSYDGTTFVVELPKNQAEHQEDPDIEAERQNFITELVDYDNHDNGVTAGEEEENSQKLLLISDRQAILIIDDNAQIRAYIRKIFKDSYKIYEAESGESGFEMIKKFVPDIVISDVVMEGLNGIELCQLIKNDPSISHIPVILLTGDPTPDLQLKGIEVGAIDFVTKPFEKDLLIARVQSVLKNKSELQNYFYNEVTLKSNTRNISEDHKDFLYKCIDIIEKYLVDPNFDVKTIAEEIGMSYSSLFKKIKSISGLSVNGFVRFVRLRKAAEILINTQCNVNEAALHAGFNDIKYFREQFIKQFGVKPSEFIRKHRAAFHKTYLVEEDFQ